MTVALDPVEFDSATRLAFYRVAQEALGNIAKHTQATAVEITLTNGENIELRIQDNGGGFDPNAVPAGHLGLIIMRERAEAVGAKLEINARARPRDRSPAVGRRRMTAARTCPRRGRRRPRPAS